MSDGPPDPIDGPVSAIRWFFGTDHQFVVFIREILSSISIVVVIGLFLFAVSGVWPPMVAVESSSMQPHFKPGDLVFIVDNQRYLRAGGVNNTGIVPYQQAQQVEYKAFGSFGDVIVFAPPNRHGPPIIHRARLWVNKGENWFTKANPKYIPQATNCQELRYCPAPYAGFITKGDWNPYYDQTNGISPIVKPSWIIGTAEFRIPELGWIRLMISQQFSITPSVAPSPQLANWSSVRRPMISYRIELEQKVVHHQGH
ncbi:MAG: S26 family signal peptidase [Halobacteriaceae archaeon]